jgi:hypothetical protein
MKRRSDECRFCTRRKCYNRIATRDGSFDEIACPKHVDQLEQLAIETVEGDREHITGTEPLQRDQPIESFYRRVDIPYAGMHARYEEALPAVLAVANLLHLRYWLRKSDGPFQGLQGPYVATVAWDDWPTDYYTPFLTSKQYTVIGAKNPVSAMMTAIAGAFIDLKKNADGWRFWCKQLDKQVKEMKDAKEDSGPGSGD